MNYLAHLDIAQHCSSSLLGNLLGDFVKGDPSLQYDASIAAGIKLHRWVDMYTDSHPLVDQAKQMFPSRTRRFAPIALDMFWDHCLAANWSDYSQQSLMEFTQYAEQVITQQEKTVDSLPERYQRVSRLMWQGRWIDSYAQRENIEFALHRMSQRSERFSPLSHCFSSLEIHYDELVAIFRLFYPQLLSQAQRQTF
jgi:acyl carrier protein phosphodiesterase